MRSADQIREHLHFSDNYLPGVASYVLVNHANNDSWKTIQLIFNGNNKSIRFPVVENIRWRMVAHEAIIDEDSVIYPVGGTIEVAGISMLMLVED
jgi:pullulanase